MKINHTQTNDSLTLALSGNLDITTAPALEKEMRLQGVRELILDMNECPYISSAGLRVLITAHRQMLAAGGSLQLVNVTAPVRSILEVTGLSKVLTFKNKPREISIAGCEFLSAGACGECYRLDRETIVKLYNEGVQSDIAEMEKKYAQAAFLLGIPTAISYDVVACGNRTGVVYEMLDARLFSAVIRDDLQNLPRHAHKLCEVARTIHAIKGDPAVFTDIKQRFKNYINQMDFFLPPEDITFLQEKLAAVPESDTCVHFDIHTSNIMIKEGEPVIIDLGDFSIGSYLFDIGLLYTIYGFPELETCEIVTKIPSDKGAEFLDCFLKEYFSVKPAAEYEYFIRHRHFFASLRLIYTITFHPGLREKLAGIVKDMLLPQMRLHTP